MKQSATYRSSMWVRRRPAAGYAVAIVLAVLGLVVRLLLGPAFLGFPFITFTPAVLAAGYFAGARAGLACAAASAALAWYFLVVPSERLGSASPHGSIAIAIFLINAVLIVLVVSGMNRAYARAVLVEEERARSNVLLEQRVFEGTRELSQANEARLAEVEARREAEARAAQTDRLDAIGRLTGGVAHDFNNMLAVIIGNLELVETKLNRGDTDVMRHIDGAMDGARRSATLTRRLLAFARLQPLDPIVAQVNELIKGIEELLIRTLGERISIECQLAPDLWHARIDPGQLEGALVNLAVNARDAMPDGGCLLVRTWNMLGSQSSEGARETCGSDQVVIEVTDTGSGMSEEVQARAFEPFFTTKEPGKGTGLGLSQLYGFMRQSGGGVQIRSSLGSGTTISLYLPRCEAPPPATQGTGHVMEAVPRASGPETILIVEDEDRVRRATSQTLQELGYRVLEVVDASRALELLSQNAEIQLVLSDIIMPGMSGTELADIVRTHRPEMPFLFMSGYSADQFEQRAERAGDLLTKPFTRDRLARHVRALLDRAV